MRELIITTQEEGQRLDRYLARYFPKTSSGFLYKMLRKKNIKRNQGKASGAEKLQAGDRIQIYFSEDTMQEFGAPPLAGQPVNPDAGLTFKQKRLRDQVRLLYQDEDIVIIHKPSGMLTQKAAAGDDSVNDYLLDYWREELMKEKALPASFKPSAVNRLDRNTSGIVLCGITVRGLQTLSALLKNRNLEKYYLCLVKGQVTGSQKAVAYLKKDRKKNQVEIIARQVPGSSRIETWYRSLCCCKEASLLRVRLITGKSHQIRAHLACLGHPVLGDGKYGDPVINRQLYKLGVHNQLLHSSELVIPGETADPSAVFRRIAGLHIIDEMPADFYRVLEKYNMKIKH